MPYWALYVTDPERLWSAEGRVIEAGKLYGVATDPPDRKQLLERGLACAYFGEDPPDERAHEWCPRALAFVGRTSAPAPPTPPSALRRRVEALEAKGARRWGLRDLREALALCLLLLADLRFEDRRRCR